MFKFSRNGEGIFKIVYNALKFLCEGIQMDSRVGSHYRMGQVEFEEKIFESSLIFNPFILHFMGKSRQ